MACQYLGSLVHIKELVAFQDLSSPLLNHILNLSHQDILWHHHTDVPGHSREPGYTGILAVKGGEIHNRRHVYDGNVCPVANLIVISHIRVHLAQEAYHSAVIQDVGLSSGMKVGMLCAGIIMGLFMHSGLFKEFFHHALHGEEIAVPVHSQGELHTLVRKLCERQRLGTVHIGQLVQAHVLVTAVIVG